MYRTGHCYKCSSERSYLNWLMQFRFPSWLENEIREVSLNSLCTPCTVVMLLQFFTNYTKMPILAFLSSLHKNKKKPVIKCYPQDRTRASHNLWFQVQHLLSELVRHVLLGRSLNFCSCTTWFLDLDDLVRINRAWIYKEPKVSVMNEYWHFRKVCEKPDWSS